MAPRQQDIPLSTFLVQHPYMYKMVDTQYLPTWHSLQNREENRIEECSVVFCNNSETRKKIATFLDNTPDFLVLFIIKLMIKNIHISARDTIWYNGNIKQGAMHADILGYNTKKKIIYVFTLCYDIKDICITKKNTRNIVHFLGEVSARHDNVEGFIVPLYVFMKSNNIILKSIDCKKKTKQKSVVRGVHSK